MIASKDQVNSFLADLRVAVTEGFYLVPRKKNLESLATIGFTVKEVKEIVKGLTVADYCRRPEPGQRSAGTTFASGGGYEWPNAHPAPVCGRKSWVQGFMGSKKNNRS